MKLNPTKCAFAVTVGNFFGFMVSQRGIEANPEKSKQYLTCRHPELSKKFNASLDGRRRSIASSVGPPTSDYPSSKLSRKLSSGLKSAKKRSGN